MDELKLLELFSKNLKQLMKENNINQEELANEIGVAQPMISRYITGQTIPSFLTAIKMSEVLFCSLDDFIK